MGVHESPSLTISDSLREDVYKRLLFEAPYIPGDIEKPKSLNEIQWLNPSLIREGQQFIRRNFFGVVCAHLGALLYGFAFRRLSTVLLRTGKSHAVKDSMLRYLSTFVHFNIWYETTIVNNNDSKYENESDESRTLQCNNNNNNFMSITTTSIEIQKTMRDVQKVRCLHSHALRHSLRTPLPPESQFGITTEKLDVVKALALDLSHIETSPVPDETLTYFPQVPMSQFDMALTQFGLVGLLVLFPVSLGIRDPRGLEGYLHLWAVFGKLLGIQDRFNVALYPDRELYHRLFLNIGVASLKNLDVRIFSLQKTLLDGFRNFTYFGSVNSFMLYGLCSKEALPSFRGENFSKLLNWTDWFYFTTFKCILILYYQFAFFHGLVDIVARRLVQFYSTAHFPPPKKSNQKR